MKAAYVARYRLAGLVPGGGFTLIEMVIVIAIMSFVAVMISMMAGKQMTGYVATSRRAALVVTASAALTLMERDIHNALPNSLRVSGNSLEMVPVSQVLRYRSDNGSVAGADILDFSLADNRFQVLGSVSALPAGARAVVYNTGLTNGATPIAGLNVYAAASGGSYPPAGAHVITPTSTTLTVTANSNGDFIALSAGQQFSLPSPRKRLYIVSKALTYLCDLSAATLTRYTSYPLQSTQLTTDSGLLAAGAQSARAASKVSACTFTYQAGNPQRAGLVTIYLKLTDSGESVELLHQVHVENAI